MPGTRIIVAFAGLMLGGLVLVSAFAQTQYFERQRLWLDMDSNRRPPNDTEFIFARVRFTTVRRKLGYDVYHRLEGWAHDYPDAEEHILQVASEATGINLSKMSYVIVELGSEEIFRYPFVYFSEVGVNEMDLTDQEVKNFREYLNRGGFAMIDDFDSQRSLDWFLDQMKRVFPDRSFVRMTIEHPIFHTFYEIPTLDIDPPYRAADGGRPTFYGYFDENGRLQMIINHNNDIGDFWEWIDQPRYPLKPSTEGLRLGIDYFIYSLTH